VIALRGRVRIAWILVCALGCGGKNKSATDAGTDDADDATSLAPYAGTWDATRNECPGTVYSELRDATWSIRLTDTTYAEVFTAQGCQATNGMIPLGVPGMHFKVDLAVGTQTCVPSPCQGNYTSNDTGSPTGVSYGILVCPKQLPPSRPIDLDWAGDTLSYTVPGAACVQRFVRRK
jgi:hypothetical protein